MNIYIIRHGETNLNIDGVLQGWLDEPLNENGRYLATVTGREMQKLRFDYCISSPLIRAKETAEIILRESQNDIPIIYDDRIREISFGMREGTKLSKNEAQLFFTKPFAFGSFPDGESVSDVCERTQDFLKELINRDDEKTYLISTHGCAVRAMLNMFYEDPTDYWHGHVPYNCVVNVVEVKDGKAELIVEDKIYYDQKYCIDHYRKDSDS